MRLKINVLLNHQLAFYFLIACLFHPCSNAFAQKKTGAMHAGSYDYIVELDRSSPKFAVNSHLFSLSSSPVNLSLY